MLRVAAVAVVLAGMAGSVLVAQEWRSTVTRQRVERLDRMPPARRHQDPPESPTPMPGAVESRRWAARTWSFSWSPGLAGIAGSVAGLASLVSYLALLAVGLPALTANVTNTVALVLYTVGAMAFSRQELAGQSGRLRRLALVTAVGGGTGRRCCYRPRRTSSSCWCRC